MEIKAKVIGVCDLESGTGKNGEWKRATVIVEYGEGEYTHTVALVNTRRADEFSKLPVGATGTFDVNLNSREYQGKFYTTIDCWRWNMDAAEQPESAQPQNVAQPKARPAAAQQQAYTAPSPTATPSADTDDLPF